MTVTDLTGRAIRGLKTRDFRVFEDGILQKLSTFTEGAKPPFVVGDSRGRQVFDEVDLTREEDLDNSSTVTYYSDSSNHIKASASLASR